MNATKQTTRVAANPPMPMPFFCSDCGSELKGKGVAMKDHRTVCVKCADKLRRNAQSRAQREMFVEQKGLFNPSAQKNRAAQPRFPASGTPQQVRRIERVRDADTGQQGTTKKETHRSLAQFVRSRGGIALDRTGTFAGELQRLSPKELGTTGLLNQKARTLAGRVQTAENMMDQANEEGYRDSNGQRFSNIGNFIYAVERDHVKHQRANGKQNPKAVDESKLLPSFRSKPPRTKKNMHWLEVGSHAAMILSGVQTASQMTKAKPKKKRRPTVSAAGKRLAQRRHGHIKGNTLTVKRKVNGKRFWPIESLVTPSLAKRWLATNKSRKDMVWARVGAIAKAITAGTYKAQSPILFKDGKLIDGRHRLEAVLRANKAVHFPIERVTTAVANPTKAKRKVVAPKKRVTSRRKSNPQPPPALAKIHEDFLGKKNSGRVMKLFTLPGGPKKAAAMATLTKIEMMNGSVQEFPQGFAWIGGVQNGDWRRMTIGLRQPLAMPNSIAADVRHNLGPVKRVWYLAKKPHLYGAKSPQYHFHHLMAEEGGKRPDLILHNGCLGFKGGSYQIQREGIRN